MKKPGKHSEISAELMPTFVAIVIIISSTESCVVIFTVRSFAPEIVNYWEIPSTFAEAHFTRSIFGYLRSGKLGITVPGLSASQNYQKPYIENWSYHGAC